MYLVFVSCASVRKLELPQTQLHRWQLDNKNNKKILACQLFERHNDVREILKHTLFVTKGAGGKRNSSDIFSSPKYPKFERGSVKSFNQQLKCVRR